MKPSRCSILLLSAMTLLPCKSEAAAFPYRKWFVSEPILKAGPAGSVDDVSVKDPTIVYHGGRYHLFYTSKASRAAAVKFNHITKNRSGCMYVSAETLEGLKHAKRHDLGLIQKYAIVAPQVFYFEPHKKWYLVAHTLVDGMPDLMPFYMTNDRIGDVHGWSKPVEIKTRKSHNGFWIDFWVICDDKKAHFFYTDHAGGVFRMECSIASFPHGLARSREVTVLAECGETEIAPWRLHEASHVYYVKSADQYLMLVEGVYPHPTIRGYWDSRTRFMFAYVADKLEGPWRRAEDGPNDFAGDPAHLYYAHGIKCPYDQVSHFELIRSGHDQRMEIADYRLTLLFQTFDATAMGPKYDYNDLPWELAIMRNYKLEGKE